MHTIGQKDSVDERSSHFQNCWTFWHDKDSGKFAVVCVLAKMQAHVEKFVRGCVLCNTNKPSNQRLGLYMPLLEPIRPWERISMDFVGGLHVSHTGHVTTCLSW